MEYKMGEAKSWRSWSQENKWNCYLRNWHQFYNVPNFKIRQMPAISTTDVHVSPSLIVVLRFMATLLLPTTVKNLIPPNVPSHLFLPLGQFYSLFLFHSSSDPLLGTLMNKRNVLFLFKKKKIRLQHSQNWILTY